MKSHITLIIAELMDTEDRIGLLQKAMSILLGGIMIVLVGGMRIRNQHISKNVGKLSTIISIISTMTAMQ